MVARITPKRKPALPKITDSTLARAHTKTPRDTLNVFLPAEQVFAPATPPEGVVPKGHKLAMDQYGATQLWATNALGSPFGGLGQFGWLGFLGYPLLAELSQLVEYRNIVEVWATEATRKWIEIQSQSEDEGKGDKIKELEDAMKKLRIQEIFKKCSEVDSTFGRAHLYLDTGQTDDRQELQTDIGDGRNKVTRTKLGKGCLKRLAVVEPMWTYPTNYNAENPLKPSWYKPDMWFVMGTQIHISRLLPFIARPVADMLKPAYSFGGISFIQLLIPYVNNWLQTRQSVNSIISAFSTFVLATNLSESLSADGDQLFKRAALFNLIRDNRGLMMLDKDSEDFTNVSAPLGGLEGLQSQAQEHMASAAKIPVVKLLGIQPAGLNASSEGEIRTFYDSVSAYQESFFRPHLTTVLDILQISLWGKVDEDLTFVFKPLFALSEREQGELDKLKAETRQIYLQEGVTDPEENREVLANEPGSEYASLNVSDVPELPVTAAGKPFEERKRMGAGSVSEEPDTEPHRKEAA